MTAACNSNEEVTPPRGSNAAEPPHPPSIALHHVNSTTSGRTSASSRSGSGDALHTPVLNGENIVMWSLSNDKSPNTTPAEIERGPATTMTAIASHSTGIFGEEAHSPPPESIYSGKVTALSPPPLTLKSDGHHQYLQHRDGSSVGGGSQSLFSGHGGVVVEQCLQQKQQSAPSTSSKQKRPPLITQRPPRWAIGGGATPHTTAILGEHPHTHHHPLPNQIGPPLSHRRVLSTGDASVMSVLTDPDSGDVSPIPVTAILNTTTTAAAGGGGSSKPPSLTSRKRGVSWDPSQQHQNNTATAQFFTTDDQEAEAAALDTLGIFQPILLDGEERNDNDGNNNGNAWMEDLMQPVLLDDRAEDDVVGVGNQVTTTQQQSQHQQQHPPLTPEYNLPLKQPSSPITPSLPLAPKSTSHHHHHVPSSLSKRPLPPSRLTSKGGSKSRKNLRSSMTQFGDEANLAIMEALQAYNLEQSNILGGGVISQREHRQKQQEEKDNGAAAAAEEEEEEGEEEEEEGGAEGNVGDGVPHHVLRPTPTHRKDVSAITLSDGLDRSPGPRPSTASSISAAAVKLPEIHIFEDTAWHEGYDAQGRIDGTLIEERESKYIEDELGIDLNADSKLGAAFDFGGVEGVTKPPIVSRRIASLSGSDQAASVPGSERSKGTPPIDSRRKASLTGSDQASSVPESERSRGSKTNKGSKSAATPPRGLRHRRSGTRGEGVLSAAQELAAMATINESDESEFNKGHAAITSDRHGIGNLLAGATLLFEQEERKWEKEDNDAGRMSLIEEEDSVDMRDDDSPRDEETGDANSSTDAKKHKRTPTTLNLFGRKPTKRERRLERQFQLKVWFEDLIAPRLPIFVRAASHSIMFVMMPLLLLAIILYYGFSNPLTGGKRVIPNIDGETFQGSWSWWVLFLLRQFFILSCVKAGEIISIDIIALRTPIFMKVFGSFATLTFVQARGWPYVLTFWGVFDAIALFGKNPFARHWLFWQDLIGLCNDENPAAAFLYSTLYMRILLSMIFVGVVTSLKRLMLATFLGRRSFAHYGPELQTILAKMILVSQVAHLARRIEANIISPMSLVASGYVYTMRNTSYAGLASDSDAESGSSPTQKMRKSVEDNSQASDSSPQGFGDSLRRSAFGRKLISSLSKKNALGTSMLENMTRSSKVEMMKFLEEWEEPDLQANAASKASIKDILQFRQAMSLVSDTYPFTQSFGPAPTRAMCVASADHIFDLLLSKTPNSEKLPFETFVELAQGKNGELNKDKVKALVRLFRPDRKGFLTKLDFITSVDSVYRELRLFRANLSNSQQIDESFHGLVNILHYFIVILIVLVIMGFNNWESLLSITTFFFSFSFMFGPASSKYFEGILLIFVRRPYDIGDKVALSDPERDTSASGSSTWFVEKVSLYTTTVRFATTNEVATYSNGSLARLRIINARRSPKAVVYVYNKFGSDVPYRMIQVFKAAVENFVKARPREWSQLNGFRATRVNLEQNFIEYVICVTHRELWQNVGPILQSKADLASFSLEVSKKLNLRYEQPEKPIHLSLTRRDDNRSVDEGSEERSVDDTATSGLQEVRDMFKKED